MSAVPDLPAAASGDLPFRFEDPGRDFPFYAGHPVRLDTAAWALVMVALALGFIALATSWPGLPSALGDLVPALLFAGLPLVALARVAPGHVHTLFGRVGPREVGWMLAFATLNLVVSATAAGIVAALAPVADNPMVDTLHDRPATDVALVMLRIVPQLVGEELLTLLPFLGVLAFVHGRLGRSRRTAVLWAWGVTALMFGAVHLPTYDWHVAQSLVVIGSARVVLTWAYVKTKNLWVAAGAHVLSDWVALGVSWGLGG